MIARRYRGSRLGIQLACATYEQALKDGITHNFIDCNRLLVSFFLKLGFRKYCGWKMHPEFGEVCVMVLRLIDDQPYFSRLGSPFARYSPAETYA